jgi:hypothetical protein
LIHTDPGYDVPGNDLKLGEVSEWPYAIAKDGRKVDLSQIPARNSGLSRVLFLKDFAEPWCALVNPVSQLGMALRWNTNLMPYACMWQETGGVQDFPHFGKTYTTALEPSTCLFGHGLIEAIEKTQTQLTLQGGGTQTLELTATIFTDGRSVKHMFHDGEVEFGE